MRARLFIIKAQFRSRSANAKVASGSWRVYMELEKIVANVDHWAERNNCDVDEVSTVAIQHLFACVRENEQTQPGKRSGSYSVFFLPPPLLLLHFTRLHLLFSTFLELFHWAILSLLPFHLFFASSREKVKKRNVGNKRDDSLKRQYVYPPIAGSYEFSKPLWVHLGQFRSLPCDNIV